MIILFFIYLTLANGKFEALPSNSTDKTATCNGGPCYDHYEAFAHKPANAILDTIDEDTAYDNTKPDEKTNEEKFDEKTNYAQKKVDDNATTSDRPKQKIHDTAKSARESKSRKQGESKKSPSVECSEDPRSYVLKAVYRSITKTHCLYMLKKSLEANCDEMSPAQSDRLSVVMLNCYLETHDSAGFSVPCLESEPASECVSHVNIHKKFFESLRTNANRLCMFMRQMSTDSCETLTHVSIASFSGSLLTAGLAEVASTETEEHLRTILWEAKKKIADITKLQSQSQTVSKETHFLKEIIEAATSLCDFLQFVSIQISVHYVLLNVATFCITIFEGASHLRPLLHFMVQLNLVLEVGLTRILTNIGLASIVVTWAASLERLVFMSFYALLLVWKWGKGALPEPTNQANKRTIIWNRYDKRKQNKVAEDDKEEQNKVAEDDMKKRFRNVVGELLEEHRDHTAKSDINEE